MGGRGQREGVREGERRGESDRAGGETEETEEKSCDTFQRFFLKVSSSFTTLCYPSSSSTDYRFTDGGDFNLSLS